MRKLFFIPLIFLFWLAISVASVLAEEKKPIWPTIAPFEESICLIDQKVGVAGAKLKIADLNGNPLYLLECYLNAYDKSDSCYIYTSDFECRLGDLSSNNDCLSLMLTENQHRSWHSRGRFFIGDMEGKWADYPEYGKVRNFRLRGMKLTIEVKSFKTKIGSRAENAPWNKDRINELNFDVNVVSDPKALSERAEPPKYAEPPLFALDAADTSILNRKSQNPWPEVKPVKKSFHLVDKKNMEAKLDIVGLNETPLYLLECYLNAGEREDPDFNYSGNFECRLTPFYSSWGQLLGDDLYFESEWQGRGRFLITELQGKCWDYPEYGRIRNFRLRGMKLTIEVKKFKRPRGYENAPFGEGGLEELDFEVNVVPDPGALSKIAEPTKYPEPPFSCSE